jgi:hypothetical protein
VPIEKEGRRARADDHDQPRPARRALRSGSQHLGAIGDFWLVFEQTRDFAKAEQLGLEFAADFRLLQDIGWSDCEPRERYALTMPAPELAGALRRLLGDAVELLIESGPVAEESRREVDSDRRYQFGYEACKVVLDNLDIAGRR